MPSQKDKIHFNITDVYETDNLVNGELQNLPAFLNLSFDAAGKYIIICETPDGEIIGNITGMSIPGNNYQWRIPIHLGIHEQQGTWKVEVHFHRDHPTRLTREIIPIHIRPELFDFSEEEVEHGDDSAYLLEVPSADEIQNVDVTSRLAELDAHWLQIDPGLNIWRYIHHATDSDIEAKFIPVLLIHGFNSSYTTWNYLVRYLWRDGFRNIFGMGLLDDGQGVDSNSQHLKRVIDEVLDLTSYDYLYIIGHSLGGLVARYFVKTAADPGKVKLLVTLGAPHMCGLSRLWGKICLFLRKNSQVTERDLTLKDGSTIKLSQKITTEADLYLLTMINICGTRIRGGDGGFKFKNNLVPDMVNLAVNYTHLSLNKNDETYSIIKDMFSGKSIIYKIRLLYVVKKVEKPPECNLYLLVKPEKADIYQRYPYEGYLQLSKENYVPSDMVIVFTYLRNKGRNEKLEIQVLNEKNKVLSRGQFIFALGNKEQVTDHFSLETGNGYQIQFAVYSYKLFY